MERARLPGAVVTVDGNTLNNLTLGSSEALMLNGNVDGFSVTNNAIHHSDNIGIDYNLYYGVGGNSGLTWNWKTSGYTNFSTYKSSIGNDALSIVANPQLVSPTTNFTLNTGSPAINAGNTDTAIIGSIDLAGSTRVLGSTVDIGAYEKQ
ncbi:hypothetical protein SAMN05444162_0336 [Paenibacillaceae bacterium GAS479]|nr:hypothetical protein SAMN05444162_0336 [Paenibacillaceae bacterium GAS479]